MYLDKFVHSFTGKILMSIVLGIGLATFFRSVCKGKYCKIIRSPPTEELGVKISLKTLIENMRKILKENGFPQIPQLSSGNQMDISKTILSL